MMGAPGFSTDHSCPLPLFIAAGDGLEMMADARIMEQISMGSPGSWSGL
jgi:hypothetical protein